MRNAFVRILLFAAFFSLTFLYASSNDPFGIDDAIDQQSRNIIYRAFASSYGEGATDANQFAPEHKIWDRPKAEKTTSEEDSHPTNNAKPAKVVSQDQIVTVYLSDVVLKALRDKNRVDEADDSARSEQDAFSQIWQSWRPSYLDQAELIYSLATLWQIADAGDENAARPPPAIFFDFIFLEVGATAAEREQFDYFIEEIANITRQAEWEENLDPRGRELGCENPYLKLACIKAAGGIPLIFARGENLASIDPSGQTEPAQTRLNNVAIIAPVRFVNNPGDYPVVTTSMTEREEAAFRAANPGEKAPVYPSPAALLYLAWCMDEINRCAWLEPEFSKESKFYEIERMRAMAMAFANRRFDPISLRWGVAIPNHFADVERTMTGYKPGLIRSGAFGDKLIYEPSGGTDLVCRMERGAGVFGFATGLSMVIRQALVNGRGSVADSLVQPCPYHLEVPYAAVASNAMTADVVHSVFDGRVIIVGARFKNSGDIIRSTVHAQLPGLHGHAMATDNLINKHNRYLKSPQKHWFLFGSADQLDFLETFVMFIVLLIVALGQWWLNKRMISEEAELQEAPQKGDRPSHWLTYTLIIVAIFVFVFMFAILQTRFLRMAPLNWISISATAIGVFIFLLRDEIGDDVSRFLRRMPYVEKFGNPMLDYLALFRTYMDLETIGFEKPSATLDDARKEKDRVVNRLYPELGKDRQSARDNSGRPPPL